MLKKIIIFAIILASFGVGIYYYPKLPEIMVSHWNAQNQPNGQMSKFWGLFMMPLIILFLAVIFLIIPKIDPLKENIQKFRKYYDDFFLVVILFMFYTYLLTVLWNLGIKLNFSVFLVPAMGVLFYLMGILLENSKRNWFVGIRTPWTLSNDNVWNKTHNLGGKLFRAAGIATFLGIVVPEYSFLILMTSVVSVSIFSVIYSYFAYRKETAGQDQKL